MQKQNITALISIEQAAEKLGVTLEVVNDLISCGDLQAFGSRKQYIKSMDIDKFNHSNMKNEQRDSQTCNMLFKDYFHQYLQSLDGSVRSRTFANKVQLASHLFDGLGHYKMSEINKKVLKAFIFGFTKKTYKRGQKGTSINYYSQSVIDKVYRLLAAAIREAADPEGENLLSANYMDGIPIPRSNRYKLDKDYALKPVEIHHILKAVKSNPKIYLWVYIMLNTGVRPSEPLALEFSDFCATKRTVEISKTISYETFLDPITLKQTKSRRPIIKNLKNHNPSKGVNYQIRTQKVSRSLLKIVHEWQDYVNSNKNLLEQRKLNNTQNFIFTGEKGQLLIYDNYKKTYDKLLTRAGLDYREYNPYRYRHNYCICCLRQGIDIKTVQMLLGDNTATMVLKVYANMNRDDVLKGSSVISKYMDKVISG